MLLDWVRGCERVFGSNSIAHISTKHIYIMIGTHEYNCIYQGGENKIVIMTINVLNRNRRKWAWQENEQFDVLFYDDLHDVVLSKYLKAKITSSALHQ